MTSSDLICSRCAPAPRCWRRPSATSPPRVRPRAQSRPKSESYKARTGGFWPICARPRSGNWGSSSALGASARLAAGPRPRVRSPPMTIRPRAEEIPPPTFDVVSTTPLNGGEINVSQSPFAVWQTNAQDIQTFNDTTLPDTLGRSAPGVTVSNVSGNEFEPDLFYRGFDATSVTGTPQGLAVYQNGTRINEVFGDVVNWDLIPSIAIDKTTIVAANPLFALNARGGALTVR